MIRFVVTCLITAFTIAHAAETYVAKPGDFSPPNPTVNDVVTWKPGSPDSVSGLTFGVDAFTSIIDASSAASAVNLGDSEFNAVYIASGIYTEGSEINTTEGMVFIGDGPGLTILDGASSHSLFTLNGPITTIGGLTIRNGLGGLGAGGISSFGSELNLINVHFVDNFSESGIGALMILSPEVLQDQIGQSFGHVVRIEGCLFSNNDAVESSCIYHEGDFFGQQGSDVIITNTTFSSNQGLAIRSIAGTLTLTQCTFYDNSSGAFDASDDVELGQGSGVILNNSLVLDSYLAPNVTSNGTNFLAVDSIGLGDLSYSNTTASVPADLIDIVLSDNGGMTGTHKLSANSVAIDAGTNADAIDTFNDPLAYDQRGTGFPRISQGIVDIGAFENLNPTLTLSIADTAISENGGSTTVTVLRNTDPSSELTVTLSSGDETEAILPATLTIPAEQISATVTLTAVDDAIVDGSQPVTISATASGFTGGSDQLDIIDDDVPTLTLSISDTAISENGGTTAVTVSRNTTNADEDLIVDLLSDDPSEATLPATLTIPAEQSSATVTLTAVDDAIVDGIHTVTISATASGFAGGSDQLDIIDDEVPTLALSIADPSISENGGSTTVTVLRNTDPSSELTVNLSSDDASEATLPATLTIPAGDASASVTLTAVDDAIVDGSQTVSISATASGFAGGSDQLDVIDDDVPTLTLSIADTGISENGGSTIVTVSRNTDPSIALTVDLSSGDEAEATLPATLTIPAEQSSATVTLTAVDDTIVDGIHTVTISATASGFAGGSDQLDIIDDDVPSLALSIADPSISENGGSTIVTVSRNTDPSIALTVNLSSSDASEASLPATLTIPAEQTSASVTLTAVDDAIVDGPHTVTISATASGFADGSDQLDIIDDDVPTLTLAIADTGISENGGSTIVTVSRNTDPSIALTVDLLSSDASEASLPATLTIPAEQTSATVTLTAIDDAIVDGPQTVTVSATASGFADGSDQLDVIDDDVPTLTLTIADTGISENGGSSIVTVLRNTDPSIALTINLSSGDETEATLPATLTIPAEQTSATVILTAVDDAIVDGPQTVTISATASGFTGGFDQLDIIDDDVPTLSLSIADTGISENGGSTIVTVSRNTDPSIALTVNLLSDDASEATLPATLTIPAEQTSATVTLTAVDDAIVDGPQAVTISATASGFADGSDQLDIIDDDVPTLTLAIADTAISENGGSTIVTVSRNTDTETELIVDLLSSDVSEATVPTLLTIPAGDVSATATLTAVDDAIVDDSQTVTISATASGFTGGSDQLDITDDDLLQITLEGGGTLSEPDSFSSSPLSPSETDLILRRNGTLGDVAINIEIASGSQSEIGNDFTINGATSSTFSVTIPDGESELSIPVQAINDFTAEVDETFVVLLLPGSFISGNTNVSVSIAQNDYGVTSLEDFNSFTFPNDGEGTLRQAIINAKAGLTVADVPPSDPVINFRPDLIGEIKLIAGAFQLDQASFSIIGPGSQQISINGENASRIFFVSDPVQDLTYRISGLTMTGGFSVTNGGAIFSDESLLLSDCVLTGSAANIGGAISNEGSLELDHCTFLNNTAITYGGAIDNYFGTLSLRSCTLAENQAEFGGGIENGSGSELWVDSSTFFGNSAEASGGAIDSFDAFANISNTTISGNEAGFGAGISNEQSTLSIWQSTVVENTALTSVGGILTSATVPVSTTLHNTIVAGNTEASSPSDLSTSNPSFVNVNQSSSNNLIGNAFTAGGLSNGINGNIVGAGATNLFRPLGDNGGPTATHALLPGSLAINAGNPAFALDSEALPLTTDQRGFPRFAFGTNDIGASEVSEIPISIVSLEVIPGASATISWTSEAGVSYDVLRSTDLSTWETIANGIAAVGGLTNWTDNNLPLDRAFYIVRSSTAE